MSVYYQNPGSLTGLPFQDGRCPDPRRSPPDRSVTDTSDSSSDSSDSDYSNPCSRRQRPPSPPPPPHHHLTSTDRLRDYDEVCYVPASGSTSTAPTTGSGYGRHVTHGQGQGGRLPPPGKVVFYQNRFGPVPAQGAGDERRRVSEVKLDTAATSGRLRQQQQQQQHPVGRKMSRESSDDRSQQTIELTWQPSSGQPSSRQPSSRQPSSRQPSSRQPSLSQSYGQQRSRDRPDDVTAVRASRQFDDDDFNALPRQPSSRQPSSRQPSSRQPSLSGSYGQQRSRDRPDDVTTAVRASRQFDDADDGFGTLPRQPSSGQRSPGQRSRRRRDSVVENHPSSGQRGELLPRRHHDDDDDDEDDVDDDVTAAVLRQQTIEDDDDFDYDAVAVPLTAVSGSVSGLGGAGSQPEVGKFSRQQQHHVPSSSSAAAAPTGGVPCPPRSQKRPGCASVSCDLVEKPGGWRDVFRKRKEYAALRKLALLLQDNRTSAGQSAGVAGSSEKRVPVRRLGTVGATEDRDSSPILKRFLNILFITTGMALLLAVVAVIIYTSIDNTNSPSLPFGPDQPSEEQRILFPQTDPPSHIIIIDQPAAPPPTIPTIPSTPTTPPEVVPEPREMTTTRCHLVPMVRDGVRGRRVNFGRLCIQLKLGGASVTTPEATHRKRII